MFCILKKKKYALLMFQNVTQMAKKVILLMIPNEEKWYYLVVKKQSPWLRGITSKHHGDFCFLNCFPPFAAEKNVDCMKRCVKIKIFVM